MAVSYTHLDVYKRQPLYSCSEGDFMEMLAKEAGVSKEDILSHDLFLYHRTEGSVWGEKGEFVSAPRLDDLQCAFCSMKGLLQAKREHSICLLYTSNIWICSGQI